MLTVYSYEAYVLYIFMKLLI